MKRDKLENPVDELHGYVFFSVRNGKALALKSFIENHFLKKGLVVVCTPCPRSIKIKLKNNKKGAWEYTTSYLWLENIDKDYHFGHSYSNFAFEIGKVTIGDYFPRTPKIVQEYEDELKLLVNSGILHKEVLELNFPFHNPNNEPFDSMSLIKEVDENVTKCLESGKINAKRNVLHLIENILLKEGFQVEARLLENSILIDFYNTKRGQWEKCECLIEFETEFKEPTWTPLIDYTYRKLIKTTVKEPKEKINKHYSNFLDFIEKDEVQEKIQETITLLDYPFSNNSFLSC